MSKGYWRERTAGRKAATFFLLNAFIALSAHHALSDVITADTNLITNGSVLAIVRSGNTIYIGGSFDYVGPYTGGGVPVSAASGSSDSTFPKINGNVLAATADGSGGWYVGGDFTAIDNNSSYKYLAHIESDGTLDTTWKPELDSDVNAIVVSTTGIVYIGGLFTTAGGLLRNALAAVQENSTGYVTAWNPNPNGTVFALAIGSNGLVYAGGDFTTIGGATRNRLAALFPNLNSSNATSWNPNADNTVNALAISTNGVYAGGYFGTMDNLPRNSLALILENTTGYVHAWDPNANDVVRALVIANNIVYAGGDFTTLNGAWPLRDRLAAIVDGSTGYVTLWDPDMSDRVHSLAYSNSMIYAGGIFENANNGSLPVSRLAAIRENTTGYVDTVWNVAGGGEADVLAVGGSKIYIGGQLSSVGGKIRNLLAAIDATTGDLTTWDPNASTPGAQVNALAVGNGVIYAGGTFLHIAGMGQARLAAIQENSTGYATIFNSSPTSTVNTIAVSNNLVYVGGLFNGAGSIGGANHIRNRLAALQEGSTGFVTSWNPNMWSDVNALVVREPLVYAGGDFTTVNGSGAGSMAIVRLAAIQTGSTGYVNQWNPNMNGAVNALAYANGIIYAGGAFTTAEGGTVSRNRLAAAIEGSTGSVVTTWNPSASDTVNALAISSSTIFAGGSFTSVGGQVRGRLAELYTSNGQATAWNPNPNGTTVRSLVMGSSKLDAGGDFTKMTAKPNQQRYARFSVTTPASAPSTPSSLAGAANGISSITWSWSDLSDEEGFRIVQSSGGIINLDANTTFWVELGLSINTAYSRQVAAFNSSGGSTSSVVTVYTISTGPVALAASNVSYNSLTLSWGANGNPSGTRYVIQAATSTDFMGSVSTIVALSANLTDTTKALSGLLPNNPYSFKILSFNGDSLPCPTLGGPSTLANTGNPPAAYLISVATVAITNTQSYVLASSDNYTRALIPSGVTYPGGLTSGSIAVSTTPLLFNLIASTTAITNANSNLGAGQNLFTNSMREFVFYGPSGGPRTENFSSNVTIIIPYKDVNQDGIVDGSSPELEEQSLVVYRLNETTQRWESLGAGTIDTTSNTISIGVEHFSVYAAGGSPAASALNTIKVYPTPWRIGSGDKFDATKLTFEGVTTNATLRIYTIFGELVEDKTIEGTGGKLLWNGINTAGHPVASGVYLWRITNPEGEAKQGRLVLER